MLRARLAVSAGRSIRTGQGTSVSKTVDNPESGWVVG
jgi:hypothetical protein